MKISATTSDTVPVAGRARDAKVDAVFAAEGIDIAKTPIQTARSVR